MADHLGRSSPRFSDRDVAEELHQPRLFASAIDARNWEIYEDYMDWSTQVRVSLACGRPPDPFPL